MMHPWISTELGGRFRVGMVQVYLRSILGPFTYIDFKVYSSTFAVMSSENTCLDWGLTMLKH